MAKLNTLLPPFASDYSGVCSALYSLDCLTVITDASCCTGHYVYYDEPRWEKEPRPVFSAQLRTMDAIMGNDGRLVERILEAADNISTQMISVVGTPVPAMTGMDMEGIACEVEALSGRPCLGFPTSGFDTYEEGIIRAGEALVNRFSGACGNVIRNSVNILGMTPLDYGNAGNDADLRSVLESEGLTVNSMLFMGCSAGQLSELPRGEMNIAVSASGLTLAKLLRKKYGTPYIAAAPLGKEAFLSMLKGFSPEVSSPEGKRVLIIGDMVMSSSLRYALRLAGCRKAMDIAGFFRWDSGIAECGDMHFDSERDYISAIKSGKYSHIIADPLYGSAPTPGKGKLISIPHPAVSADLYSSDVPRFLSPEFEEFIKNCVIMFNDENKGEQK